jgi:adenylate cyclase
LADGQRLAAILALDIEDFASIEASNKKAALTHLRSLLGIVRDAVAESRGTLFSAERDTFLAEFPSPVAAIMAVNAIHEDVAAYNEEQKEAQRMSFRAAVHVGGVAGSGRKLSGEAISVAQSLRNFAAAGSTAVVGATHQQVEQRVDLEWEDLGKQAVGGKNVRVLRGVENIDAYASGGVRSRLAVGLGRRGIATIALGIIVTVVAVVLLVQQGPRLGSGDDVAGGGGSPFEGSVKGALKKGFGRSNAEGDDEGEVKLGATGEETAEDDADGSSIAVSMKLPSEPSIAVLPFATASSDRSQNHLALGLAQEVAVALSQSRDLFVASPHSALKFSASTDAVAEAARAMGVRFVLLGKIVRSGDRVRLSIQLMENGIPAPLLVRSFDVGSEQLSGVGRRVAQLTASAVGSALTVGDINRLKEQEASNFEAFDLLLRGHNALRQENKAATDEAIRLFEAAINADRSFARAYEGLAIAHMSALQWADASPSGPAFEAAQRAVALDDGLSAAHSILGASYLAERDYDRALQSAEKAVAVNPNDADGYAMLGRILNWTGSPERGEEEIEKALRRNPRPPFWYLFGLGHARFLTQDYQGAIIAFRRGVQTNPSWLPNRYYLAASYAQAGDPAKAEFELGQGAVRTVMPAVIAGDLTPYRNSADLNHFMEAMRKAGVR